MNGDDRLGSRGGGFGATPLLFLLDGVLSQDEDRVDEAVEEIRDMGCETPEESPCFSKDALCSILSSLLAFFPELASMRSNHDGSLPLHFAASLGYVPAAAVILAKFPPAATTPNLKGKIPLHYAAREGRLDMVNYFLRTTPETASIATEKGKLALHFAAGEGHEEITFRLLWHYPRSAALASAKGKLPLHFCARWGYVAIAKELLRVYADAIRALDWEGSLPLHDAAREGQVHMGRLLLERFPTALRICNLRGEIPLFPAVRSGCIELVILMLQAWPMGGKQIVRNIQEDDAIEGWNWDIVELLLRGAVNQLTGCALVEGVEPPTVFIYDDFEEPFVASSSPRQRKKAKKAKDSGVDRQFPRLVPDDAFTHRPPSEQDHASTRSKSPVLHDSKPDAAKKRKRSHSTTNEHPAPESTVFVPLLAALETKSSFFVIRHILDKRPGDIHIVDGRGRLALHWAASYTQDERVMDLVTNKMVTRQAAETFDNEGHLPLHLAIQHGADPGLIQALLDVYPAAGVKPCRARGKFHNMSPIGMAIKEECDLSTIFQVLRVDPSCLKRGTSLII